MMQWPMTSKPWAICIEMGTGRCTVKPLIRNNMQLLSPTKVTSTAPSDIICCIVHAMRVAKMIPINNLKSKTFLGWTERFEEYVKNLPRKTGHYFRQLGHLYLKVRSMSFHCSRCKHGIRWILGYISKL